MSDALIRAAIETRVAAWAAGRQPALPVCYENTSAAPAKPYARVTLLPATTENLFVKGNHRLRSGVCQVALILPPGVGTAQADALAASLDAAFPLNVALVQGGVKVVLMSPFSRGPAIPEADAYYVPISCTYRSDAVL